MLLKKPFGRAWRYPRTPQCKFEEVDSVEDMGLETSVDRLFDLNRWAEYFRIQTALPMIIKIAPTIITNNQKYFVFIFFLLFCIVIKLR